MLTLPVEAWIGNAAAVLSGEDRVAGRDDSRPARLPDPPSDFSMKRCKPKRR